MAYVQIHSETCGLGVNEDVMYKSLSYINGVPPHAPKISLNIQHKP